MLKNISLDHFTIILISVMSDDECEHRKRKNLG